MLATKKPSAFAKPINIRVAYTDNPAKLKSNLLNIGWFKEDVIEII